MISESASVPNDSDSALDHAGSLALSTLTDILKDPDASTTDKRLAAACILRHVAAVRRVAVTPAGRSPGRARAAPPPTHHHQANVPQSECDQPEPRPAAQPPRADPFNRLKQDELALSAMSRLIDLAGKPHPARGRIPAPLAADG